MLGTCGYAVGRELSGVVLVEDEPPVNYSFTGRAVASVLGRWLAHRVFFRGGWTVHVEEPDEIRSRSVVRTEALPTPWLAGWWRI